MVSLVESPIFNTGLLLAWAGVTVGALYRHHRGDWSRRRAVLFVSLAAGWAAQSIHGAATLLGVERRVADWLFGLFAVAFVVGLGYTAWLRWRAGR